MRSDERKELHVSDMGGLGIGSMQEAGRKMQAQVNEAEARRGRPGGPHHEPPRKDGFFKRLLARLKR